MKFSKWAMLMIAAGVTIGGVAQASTSVMFDDFNFNVGQGASASDNTASNGGVVGPRGTGGTLFPGWTRSTLYADLVSGDAVSTQDCANCQEGHFVNDANSVGNGYWGWSGGPTDFSNTSWALQYGVDVAGADIVLSFVSGGIVVSEIWWQDLTNVGCGPLGTPCTITGAVGAIGQVDAIFLDAFSVGGNYDPAAHGAGNYGSVVSARNFGAASVAADLNVDNLTTTVPEPTTLALLGVALAALGASRKGRKASAPSVAQAQ